MTCVGREAVASGKLGTISPESEGTSPLLATGVLDAMGAGLLGEIHMEGCHNVSSIVLERIPSISSIMLGPVAISLGYSVTECGVEIGIDNH